MGLPANEQRILDQIEQTLRADDERLFAFFAGFGGAAGCSPPRPERLPGPRRYPRHSAGPEVERLVRRPKFLSSRSRRSRRTVQALAAVPAAFLIVVCLLVVWIPLPHQRCCAPGRGAGVVLPRHPAAHRPPRTGPGWPVVPGL